MRARSVRVGTSGSGGRDAARRAALDLCRRLDPSHPFSEQRRSVYRISPDEYLVVVVGMTKTFHFRVSVAERLA